MSSECNNIKLAIRNDKSKVVCAMCKKCLITNNHDVCVLNYVNGMNSYVSNQTANVSNIANQKKNKEKVRKNKKLGSNERLATPRPQKPITFLSASNAQEPTRKRSPNYTSFLGRFRGCFKKELLFARNLEGVDLLKGNRTTNLYTINLYEMTSTSPICLMAHASSTNS
ncbi:hypothetical protein Tco_0983857 [Tanacetum coccineum]